MMRAADHRFLQRLFPVRRTAERALVSKIKLWVFLFGVTSVALANSDALIEDPVQKALYDRLTHDVGCMICNGQSILESNEPLAEELRGVVRAQVLAGKTEAEIRVFLVEQYGDFVLYWPGLRYQTALLWAVPIIILPISMVVLWRAVRRRAGIPAVGQANEPADIPPEGV